MISSKNIPSKPGVYLFKNKDSQVLYVGKAIDLKKRVTSYLQGGEIERPWIQVMLGLAVSVETIVVDTETEALLLEATLIKQHLPRFNIKLTDDKNFPYIKISTNEAIPRFSVTRKQINNGAKYFGPYLSARSAHHTLEFLRSVFGIHISNRVLKPQRKPCFYCQLNNHECPQNNSETNYSERLSEAIDFLKGKRGNLVKKMEEAMKTAAQTEQFELAARLRDRLQSLKQTGGQQQVVSTNLDSYDAIGIAKTSSLAAVSVLFVREGRVSGQRTYYFDIQNQQESKILREFFTLLYSYFPSAAKQVFSVYPTNDQQALEQLLNDMHGHSVQIRVAQRGNKRDICELANKNAQAQLEMRLLEKNDDLTGVIALQELLKLDFLPERIEAVDISNLGTSEAVGATVCFINGKSDKNEYRRYKIKTVEGQNDFAMIREVVARRLHDTSRPLPDVFVIDGGIQQLRFAMEAVDAAAQKPKAVISLAKKPDRIFIPERKTPIPAPRGNKGLRLLSRIRDEVHRFGITFQRARQKKKSLSTEE